MTKPGDISMDWIELFADDLKRLTKLFANCPGLHGCITAVLQEGMGAVFVDKPDDPQIAYMQAGAVETWRWAGPNTWPI